MPDEVEVVGRLFAAVENRDLAGLLACYSDDVEINEANSLPWGGVWRSRSGAVAHAEAFARVWGVLQEPETCSMDPHFWDDGSGTVCALFRNRAVDPASGDRFDAPEVGIYRVRAGRVVHSQMFHADSGAVLAFLRGIHSESEDLP